MKRLLCALTGHALRYPGFRPWCVFVDRVTGREVFRTKCACGRTWLREQGLFGYKVERFPDESSD